MTRTHYDQFSGQPNTMQSQTIRSLARGMQLVCISRDSSFDKNKYLNHVFSMNNYNDDFIKRKKYMKVSPNCTFDPYQLAPPQLMQLIKSNDFAPTDSPTKSPNFFRYDRTCFHFRKKLKVYFDRYAN